MPEEVSDYTTAMRPRGTLSWISQEMLFRQFSCLFGLYLFTPPPVSRTHMHIG